MLLAARDPLRCCAGNRGRDDRGRAGMDGVWRGLSDELQEIGPGDWRRSVFLFSEVDGEVVGFQVDVDNAAEG